MSNSEDILLKKGSTKQEFLKDQVAKFLVDNKKKSLSSACKEIGSDYQLIYGQLNGQRQCQIKTIEKFVEEINSSYQVELLNGNYHINKRQVKRL